VESTVHAMDDGTEPELRTFLVEHYWPGVTPGEFEEAAERVRVAAGALAREGRPIRFLHSTLVPEDELGFCALAAESRGAVEEAYARAGVGFDRVVESLELVGQTGVGGTKGNDTKEGRP